MRTNFLFKNNKSRAFSLIELSVVITIISLVLVVVLTNTVSGVGNFKTKITQDRITIINNALSVFVTKNKRLPCPAAINLAKTDANYGNEISDCATGTGTNIFVSGSGKIVYGMVPTKALGLSTTIAADGFGNKFAYIVDKTFTTVVTPTSAFVSSNGTINVQSYNGSLTSLNNAAIFAIVSYGANGNYAFPANSATQNPVSSDVDEIANNTTNFANLIAYTNRSNTTFDDIVFYKDKSNFLLDAKASVLENTNTTGEAKTTFSGCIFSASNAKTGITTSTTVNPTTTPTQQFCNETNFDTASSIYYTCDGTSKVITVTSGSCSCAYGYYLSGSSCLAQPQCTFSGSNAKTGITTTTTVNYTATLTQQFCNASNFNTSDFIKYTCGYGTISFDISTACDTCATGYTFSNNNCNTCDSANHYVSVGGSCVLGCTVPAGNNTTTTTVAAGTTSTPCDTASGYAGNLAYTCSTNGSFAVTTACALAPCTASGGVSADTTSVSGATIFKFTTAGTYTFSCPTNKTAQILVVGGGGSGGSSRDNGGSGGGGGGGVAHSSSYTIVGGTTYNITVGAGGASVGTAGVNGQIHGNSGSNSSFNNAIIAYGGGGGGAWDATRNGSTGGSGGGGTGGTSASTGGSATKGTGTSTVYGNAGGAGFGSSNYGGGGGGGAGGAGGGGGTSTSGAGGAGLSVAAANAITGTTVYYGAGGGAGGGGANMNGGNGGSSGLTGAGGAGGKGAGTSSAGGSAANGTGSGGGGANKNASGAGGSGIVVIRY